MALIRSILTTRETARQLVKDGHLRRALPALIGNVVGRVAIIRPAAIDPQIRAELVRSVRALGLR